MLRPRCLHPSSVFTAAPPFPKGRLMRQVPSGTSHPLFGIPDCILKNSNLKILCLKGVQVFLQKVDYTANVDTLSTERCPEWGVWVQSNVKTLIYTDMCSRLCEVGKWRQELTHWNPSFILWHRPWRCERWTRPCEQR